MLEGKNILDRLDCVIDWVKEVGDSVRKFHSFALEPVTHWYHILVSVTERIITSTGAIRLLLAQGMNLEAAAIVRLIYEMALTFHLNWLAPEFTGNYLKVVAEVGPNGWKKIVDMISSDVSTSASVEMRQLWVDGHRRMGEICFSPNQKANLSPIGAMHDRIYPFLSGIAHQDFGALTDLTARLDNPWAESNNGLNIDTLELVTNVSASSILFLMSNDIGFPKKQSSE